MRWQCHNFDARSQQSVLLAQADFPLLTPISAARFCQHLSKISVTTEIAFEYFNQIITFLEADYLDILTQRSMHIVYHVDIRVGPLFPVGGRDRDGGSSSSEGKKHTGGWSEESEHEHEHKEVRRRGEVGFWTECIQTTVLFGYDQVLSVSEDSINQLLMSLWRRATKGEYDYLLSKWSHEVFSATFDSLKVKLLSNGKVIVWVNINEGYLRVQG